MKKIFLLFALAAALVNGNAQIKDPVSWATEVVKKSADTYTIILKANFEKPWHVYSQTTPPGGPVPTQVSFTPNPLVKLEGKVKEVGKMQVIDDKIFGVKVHFFSNEVTYMQTVKVKAGIKTNIVATVKFMVCDDNQCLPPAKKTFDLKLQ